MHCTARFTSRPYPWIQLLILVPITASSSSLRATSLLQQAVVSDRVAKCSFDHSELDHVLKKFVKTAQSVEGIQSSLFDYAAVLSSNDDLAALQHYVASLRSFKPSCLTSEGKRAFWANAYNALIINLVLSEAHKSGGHLTQSIRDLQGNASSVWAREAGIIHNKAMSLEDVLTAGRSLKDPRFHAAVNCASLSCPDLRASAYTESGVHSEFDEQVEKWLSNPSKGVANKHGKMLVSHIFGWHAEDFSSLSSFLAEHLSAQSASVKVAGYLPYNWNLNVVH